MINNKPQRYSEISEDMIRDWKAKYGDHSLEELSVLLNEGVEDENAEIYARFVVKVPSRHEMEVMEANSKDSAKVNKILVENCVLGGDLDAIDKYGFVYAKILEWGAQKMSSYKPLVTKKL